MALLEIENLTVSFVQYQSALRQSVVPVVTNLDLQLHAGEIVAVVGASGSGKSLLAHAVMGLLPDNAVMNGSIRYEGRQLNDAALQNLRGKELRLIPQSSAYLNPLLKVEKQLKVKPSSANRRLGGWLDRAKSRAQLAQVKSVQEEAAHFHIFDMEAMKSLYPFQLSGGMARKVLLSTAAAQEAKLIIADEPTPGLDVEAVKEALAGLKELAAQGCAVLLITHDIEAAVAIADRVAVMNEGRCVDIAPVEHFSQEGEKLKHPYTRALWQALPCNGLKLADRSLDKIADRPKQLDDSDMKKYSSGEELLQGHDIAYRYKGGPWLFRQLNVTLRAGEVIGLVGPSGIGKSSLASIMAGYMKPMEGRVIVGRQEDQMDNMQQMETRYAKPHIYPVQLVLQHPEHAFNPRMKLKASLAESWQPDEVFLKRLGISPQWLERWPHELSGGELQRISIARALHPEAQILIADEMTAMLDAITQAQIWHEVLAIAKERGMAVVVISHDPYLIERLCDRTISLKQAVQ